MTEEYIASDSCGLNGTLRFTHMPSGDTIVCHQHVGRVKIVEWLKKYQGLTIHNCPGRYSSDCEVVGTVAEAIRYHESFFVRPEHRG